MTDEPVTIRIAEGRYAECECLGRIPDAPAEWASAQIVARMPDGRIIAAALWRDGWRIVPGPVQLDTGHPR